MAAASITPERWATSLLGRLGIKPTSGALQAVVGWARAEGGHWNNDAHFNPLNTTQPMPGAGNTGSQGNIKQYTSWGQGLDATVKTLRNGRYDGILHALKVGDPAAVASAIGHTPWGTGGDLVARTIAGTKVHGGARPLGPVSGRGGSVPSSSASSPPALQAAPAQSGGAELAALLTQMQAPVAQGPRPSMGLAAPAFSASPVLAGGGRAVVSSGGPQESPGVPLAQALAAIKQLPGAPVAQDAPAAAAAPDGSASFSTPPKQSGTANFEGTKVAAWIKPALAYAREHGWKGKVNSGFRSFADQTRIYNSGVRPAAKPGTSNHEGTTYPRGAVDVSDAATLARILEASPYRGRLKWAGAKDPVHFSHPHNGSY